MGKELKKIVDRGNYTGIMGEGDEEDRSGRDGKTSIVEDVWLASNVHDKPITYVEEGAELDRLITKMKKSVKTTPRGVMSLMQHLISQKTQANIEKCEKWKEYVEWMEYCDRSISTIKAIDNEEVKEQIIDAIQRANLHGVELGNRLFTLNADIYEIEKEIKAQRGIIVAGVKESLNSQRNTESERTQAFETHKQISEAALT